MSRILVMIIKAYQYLISPIVGSNCRFTPSCSQYVIEALQQRGALMGIYLGGKRILRCHPWCDGGYDPVPKK